MKCENCGKHVKEALVNVDGVISANANLADRVFIADTTSDVSN